MKKVGDVELRLASGPIPHYNELKKLAKSIIQLLEFEFGTEEIIKRFSDPLWFNSFACLLGFEWNYSGMTTVTLRAIKESLEEIDTGLIALGGKGKSANVIEELENKDLQDKLKDKLSEISKMSAKVDSALVQDGYSLYFHFILSDEKGNTTVINQKMNIDEKMVRRFHWIHFNYFEDPQTGFGSKNKVLNLSSSEMKETRKAIIDLLQEKSANQIASIILRLKNKNRDLLSYFGKKESLNIYEFSYYLHIPKRVEVKAIEIAKQAYNFKELINLPGVGPGLLRSLVYVVNLVYGTPISWKDPIVYTFAHGTKVGKPYPVRKKLMIEEAEVIENAIKEAKIGNTRKLRALKRLRELITIQ